MRHIFSTYNKFNTQFFYVTLLIIFAITTRLYLLDTTPISLYFDEITSVYYPFFYLRGELELPTVSVLISIVTGTFFVYELTGPSAFWIRLPSALYGTLFVIVCWALGKRLYGTRAGIIAGFLAAVVPWSFHFSRYGVVVSISYTFYVTLAVYLLIMYLQTGKANFKFLAFLVVGVSFYTHSMAIIFNILFFPILLIAGLISNHAKPREIMTDILLFFITSSIIASPFMVSYLSSARQLPFTSYTTIGHSDSILGLMENIIKRAYLHLSPDFLVLTGGKSFAVSTGSFNELITTDSLYYYATAGKVGMLNVYGVIIYVGFLWLMYRTVKFKKIEFKTFLLIWWIISYAIATGFAYYDNPNPARNIVGLPAFILAISLVVNKIWSVLFKPSIGYVARWKSKTQRLVKILKFLFIMSLILPSVFYFYTYFATYGYSYNYFDYDYKLLSNYLSENKLWDNTIVINETRPDKWYGKTILSFYNYSARENIVMGNLDDAVSLLGLNEKTIVYVTRDVSNRSDLPTFVSYRLLGIIYYPDNTPVFAMWKLIGFNETLLLDDDLASQWTPVHGTLSGQRGVTIISDEDSIVKSGFNSLKIILTSGSWDWSGIRHNFESPMNWSDTSAISFQCYGNNSQLIVQLIIACEGGEFYYSFTDDFYGWRRVAISFSDMQSNGLQSLDKVVSLTFAFWGVGETAIYLDEFALLKG